LERNLCFVDTPGYAKELSTSSEVIEKIVHYVEAQFQHVSSFDQMPNGDVINLLSGNGAPLVDAVIILLSHSTFLPILLALISIPSLLWIVERIN
jgi:hypothetical protein